jgi:hypothetical protein
MATDLIINIASQFTGKSAFEKAEKSTKLLTKSVKNLAKVTGVALSATAILAYSKKSIKAAADDMKAQKLLAQSLKNVGLAYATVNVENFIGQLEKQTGILDDELRPAFSKLAQVTGSVTKTQSLLKLAFDVSSGSGLDYKSTVDILAKAYVNNNKGLSKLSLGLTQAEIQAMDFADVVELLTKRFDGAGAAAVDSYSGSMAILATSSANAAEIIGTSLIGAIETLGGNDGIKNLGTDIENAAKSTANLIDEMAFLISQIGSIPVVGGTLSTFGKGIQNILGNLSPQRLAELTREIQAGRGMNAAPIAGQPFTTGMSITSSTDAQAKTTRLAKAAELEAIKRNKELAKLAKDRANREKEIAKQKKDQLALDKAALALGKGESIFDLDKIQIAAAILSTQENIQKLGTAATDQQKLQLANDAQRLTVKQLMLDLEDAIADKDVERATTLSKQLNTELAILGTLTGQTYKLGEIDKILEKFKPKDLINLDNLDAAIRKLLEIAGSRFDFLSPIMPSQDRTGINDLAPDITSRYVAGDPEAIRAVEAHADAISMLAESELALADALFAESERALNIATASLTSAGLPDFFNPAAFRMRDEPIRVEIIDKTSGLIEVVQNAVIENTRYGNSLTYTGNLTAI